MIKSIALIFDPRPRPETTGFYCRRALGNLVNAGELDEVEHFLPGEVLQARRRNFDLELWIDDGIKHDVPPTDRRLAWWVIDTHLQPSWSVEHSRRFSYVFCAQKAGAELLRAAGHAHAEWLPLACDPEIHARSATAKQFDFSFVGHLFPGPRTKLLQRLAEEFPNHYVGQKYFREMAECYARSKVVFNRSVKNDLNMRFFEGLASGSLLVTDQLTNTGVEELFEAGRDFVAYTDEKSLLELVHFYLEYPEEREAIAARGQRSVLAAHTYEHRMRRLLTSTIEPTSRTEREVASRPSMRAKTSGYFEHSRPEVLEVVPRDARRVLDIGCGSGRLGAELKRRQEAFVIGIERDEQAAAIARQSLDRVIKADLEQETLPFDAGDFDCVICADVLEHLRAPSSLLRQISQWLAPEGRLIVSLPNTQHHSVIGSLLNGNWTYQPSGLLDDDHVRFFTRIELEKLLYRAGFRVERIAPLFQFGESPKIDEPVHVGAFEMRISDEQTATDLFAYQWLVVSEPLREDFGLTSIILVTHNEWAYTQSCLESIHQFTDEPIEIIVVDNGSTDGTPDYLSSHQNVRLKRNAENRGFPAAVNQGLAIANGENLLLLNNDTIVTTGWLRKQLIHLQENSSIGVIGPCSNNVSGPQQIPVSYRNLSDLDGFAWRWGQEHSGQFVQAKRIVGFCFLFRREVYEQLGGLDERFGVGCFEDDDFCRRAIDAGYQVGIARDAFVHHFGSRTFLGSGQDLAKILTDNERVYQEKWRQPSVDEMATNSRPPRPRLWYEQTKVGLKLIPNPVRSSGCLIVRNNEATIEACLGSLRPWVDEIVVVDTGSTDRTPEIAAGLGARVFHWQWRDDFAAARNESLRHALGEWIFWMDSDDELPPESGRRIRELIESEPAENLFGFVGQVHCPGITQRELTVVDHIKLFRNLPGIEFEFRIHEQVIPSIRRLGGEIAWSDIYVVHSGSDQTPRGRLGKWERDLRILHLEVADRPDHPFVLFNLGMTYADTGQFDRACQYLRRCLEVSAFQESHVRKAYALYVNALQQLGRFEEANELLSRGLSFYPGDKELLFRRGMLSHSQGELEESIAAYKAVLSEPSERYFTSVDVGITGVKARHNLAIVYGDNNQPEQAIAEWDRILAVDSQYAPAARGLIGQLLELGREQEARRRIEGLREVPAPQSLLAELDATVLLHISDYTGARSLLEKACACHPDSAELAHLLCRLIFEKATPSEAEPWLLQLSLLEPNNPSVWANLGMANLCNDDLLNARRHFVRSLELRPGHPATVGQLKRIDANLARIDSKSP